ncbi:MAG: OmpP1/FadL family transporter [Acidiferrobacter sp.]
MVSTKKWTLATAIAAAIALPATALATTAGYFQLGYSSISDGMAGATAALPQDSMIQAINPAGIAFVGSRLDLGVAGFWPHRSYASGAPVGGMPSPGSHSSSTNFYLIPHVGYSQRLSHNNYVGIAIYGNGGMSTNYHSPAASPTTGAGGPYYGGQTGVNLSQLFVQATYSRKFMRHDAVGLSLIFARQTFSADGLGAFGGNSTDPQHLSGNGVSTSTGVGFKVGGQFRLMPGINLGVAYSPRMSMSKFSKYSGLFAGGGRFDIPANGVIGLAFKPTSSQVLAFDFQRIYYNDVPAIANPGPTNDEGCNPNTGTCQSSPQDADALGAPGGAGFGWQNISVYKLGYQIAVNRTVTARVGFAYNTQPIPSSQVMLNVLAPGVIQRHVTAGFTVRTARHQDFTMAAMYGLPQSVYGNAPAGFGGAPIKISMHEYQVEANWGWKF